MRIREQRQREELRQQENEAFAAAQSTMNYFVAGRKKDEVPINGEPTRAKIVP